MSQKLLNGKVIKLIMPSKHNGLDTKKYADGRQKKYQRHNKVEKPLPVKPEIKEPEVSDEDVSNISVGDKND